MNLQEQIFDRTYVSSIWSMVNSKLITYRETQPWADMVISKLEKPPFWVVEISTEKNKQKIEKIISDFLCAEPFHQIADETDETIACYFLRYKRGEISWATFLWEAGLISDAQGARVSCEYFYYKLNDLEDKEFASDIEVEQRKIISADFQDVIGDLWTKFEVFRTARQRHNK